MLTVHNSIFILWGETHCDKIIKYHGLVRIRLALDKEKACLVSVTISFMLSL